MVTKEEALRGLNLNEKEIKAYLSNLMLGSSTAQEIAKKANLNRVTTYDILKALIERGFTSYTIKSGVKYFEATDPSKFIDELKEKQAKVKEVLPELNKLKSSILKKPEIETYEGLPGLKSIFNDILKENQETLFIGAPKMLESLNFYFKHFITQKRKQKIFSKVITEDIKEMHEYQKNADPKYLTMKFIKDKIETTKIIYSNKTAYLTFKENNSIGILIKNKEITNTERMLFKEVWNK